MGDGLGAVDHRRGLRRPLAPRPPGLPGPAAEPRRWRGEATLERAATAGWMVALAAVALTLLDPDDDDAYYVHLARWISEHGRFPLRDIVFSTETLPALYYPPIASYDALTGALSRLTNTDTAAFVYYVVPPLAAAVTVLALRRMLRSWRVAMLPVALSVALLFLLASAQANETYGAFVITRPWQGKSLLLAVLVPLLFALLVDFGQRPSRAGAARLGLAGIAGVGLSTTGIFVVPTIAAGCMAALALRSWRAALAGFAAATAYPALAAVVTKASGGRVPDVYTDADVVAPDLVHIVLNPKALALLGLAAALIAPALIPRALAARMVAAVVLLVGLLYAPACPSGDLPPHRPGPGAVAADVGDPGRRAGRRPRGRARPRHARRWCCARHLPSRSSRSC